MTPTGGLRPWDRSHGAPLHAGLRVAPLDALAGLDARQ